MADPLNRYRGVTAAPGTTLEDDPLAGYRDPLEEGRAGNPFPRPLPPIDLGDPGIVAQAFGPGVLTRGDVSNLHPSAQALLAAGQEAYNFFTSPGAGRLGVTRPGGIGRETLSREGQDFTSRLLNKVVEAYEGRGSEGAARRPAGGGRTLSANAPMTDTVLSDGKFNRPPDPAPPPPEVEEIDPATTPGGQDRQRSHRLHLRRPHTEMSHG